MMAKKSRNDTHVTGPRRDKLKVFGMSKIKDVMICFGKHFRGADTTM